jgi:hypothetical protein
MSRRTGLGRHGHIEDAAGDPLEGLVNLFDIGIVLAVAFLIAGLGLTLDQHIVCNSALRASRTLRHCPRRRPVHRPPVVTGGRSALSTGSAMVSSCSCRVPRGGELRRAFAIWAIRQAVADAGSLVAERGAVRELWGAPGRSFPGVLARRAQPARGGRHVVFSPGHALDRGSPA